jgi:L-asparaginase
MYPGLYFHPESQAMPSADSRVLLIGTGGTIAGKATKPGAQLGYTAGALAADDLVAAVPALAGQALETLSLAQLDSCDMDHATWQRLAQALVAQLSRPEVAGVVVTHGTDTLEETASFVAQVVAADKPVVFTAAMRPATAASPDGPQNLLDAVTLAREPGARGVLAVLGGTVWAGAEIRKLHGWRVDAFGGGDAGPLGVIEDGVLRRFRDWPQTRPSHGHALHGDPAGWPVVEIVTSHAGARAATVEALVAAGARGLVIAGTGNGSVHRELLAAARQAQRSGVRVLRASRCVAGGVVGSPEGDGVLPSAGSITPAQARVQLMLELMREQVLEQTRA